MLPAVLNVHTSIRDLLSDTRDQLGEVNESLKKLTDTFSSMSRDAAQPLHALEGIARSVQTISEVMLRINEQQE